MATKPTSVAVPMHQQVWRLAGPMILSNLSTPLLGLVDTAVVGHLESPHYLGAVAIGALIFSFLYWGFGFLRMGTSGLVAQAHGARDADEIRALLGRALLLALVFSSLLLLLQVPIGHLALSLVEGSEPVLQQAALYYEVRIWSAPATLANYVLLGWFLGMQNARAPLYLLLVVNIANIVLDLWFVVVLEMGVAGVAWASVASEYLGLLIGMILVTNMLRHEGVGQWQLQRILHVESLRSMVALNHNIFIRTLLLIFSFAFFTVQGAKQGDVILAANAVLMNFQTFMAYGLDGFAHAAEALVGSAIGQRDRAAFRRAVRVAGFWSLLVAGGFTFFYAGFGGWVVEQLTDIAEVRGTAMMYMGWVIISPLISVWSYLFDGVYIGATRAVEMRNAMLVSVLLCYLPAWYLLQPYGNHGLWAALLIFMAARGATMGIGYYRMWGRNSMAVSD